MLGWFANLASLFRPDPSGPELFNQLRTMMATAKQLFDAITEPLFDEERPLPERELVYGLDGELNRAEVEIRRRLLTAIAINPERDLGGRMLLMSGSKHVERCGDLAKNIFEVFEHRKPFVAGPYNAFLREQRDFVSTLFDRVWRVIEAGDTRAAAEIVAETRQFAARDAEVIQELIGGAESPSPVAVAMLTRLQKRVMGHLVNIARDVISL
jgi:phosphate uptake regulator